MNMNINECLDKYVNRLNEELPYEYVTGEHGNGVFSPGFYQVFGSYEPPFLSTLRIGLSEQGLQIKDISEGNKYHYLILDGNETIAEAVVDVFNGLYRIKTSNRFRGNQNEFWRYIRDINGAASFHRAHYNNPDLDETNFNTFINKLVKYYNRYLDHLNKFEKFRNTYIGKQIKLDGELKTIDSSNLFFDPGNNGNIDPSFIIHFDDHTDLHLQEIFNRPLSESPWYKIINNQGKKEFIDISNYIL